MNDYRRNARAAGVLFIIATLATLAGSLAAKPILSDPNYLAVIPANESRLFVAMLLKLICAFTSSAIALALYPVLRRQSEALALGAAAFRIVEGVFYAAGVVSLMLLVSLSRLAASATPADSAYFSNSAALLLDLGDWLGFVVGVVFFAIGALLYYWAFYRSGLIPRWLSGWGVASAAMAAAAAVLVLFRVIAPVSAPHMLLNFSILVQEMVLAVWLLARGFDPRAIGALPAGSASPAGVRTVSAEAAS